MDSQTPLLYVVTQRELRGLTTLPRCFHFHLFPESYTSDEVLLSKLSEVSFVEMFLLSKFLLSKPQHNRCERHRYSHSQTTENRGGHGSEVESRSILRISFGPGAGVAFRFRQ